MSSYVPMYVSTTRVSKAWTSGSMHVLLSPPLFSSSLASHTLQKYDPDVAWWNFCVVGNYVARYYHFAVTSVRELQSKIQSKFDEDLFALEKSIEAIIATHSGSPLGNPPSLSLTALPACSLLLILPPPFAARS